MKHILTLGTMAALLHAAAIPAMAGDARSIALGGSVIANGKGVHGALSNPASMMAMQRREETTHIRFGFTAEVRDTGDAIDTLSDSSNQDLINDIDNEIETLSAKPVTCVPFFDSGDTECLTETQPLSDLSGRLLDIIDLVDGESIEAFGNADLGMAYTGTPIPFAINVRVSAAGSGSPDIANGDRSYISEFNTVLDGNSITLDELSDSTFLEVDAQGIPLNIVQPEDVLETSAQGGFLLRTQLSVSLATTLLIAGHQVDVGVTPKFSSLQASSLDINVRDEFLDTEKSASDRFKDNEVTDNSFTADVGGSMMLPNAPVQVAAVIRNLVSESISTREGFEFETTPQLVLGAAYQQGKLSLTGDLALNSAKQDNFETQKIGLGAEFGTHLMAIRGGISHDSARKKDSTSLSVGFGLGPLEIGGRVAGIESLEIGAQLAFSFK